MKRRIKLFFTAFFAVALLLNITITSNGIQVGKEVKAQPFEFCFGADLQDVAVDYTIGWPFYIGATLAKCCVNTGLAAAACDQSADDSRCLDIVCTPMPL